MTALGHTNLEFISSNASLYHCKIDRNQVPMQADPEEIMTAVEFKLALLLKEDMTGVGLDLRKLEVDLPYKVLLGGLIHEIDKQIGHVPAWIKHCYKARKRELNFQFDNRHGREELKFDGLEQEPVKKKKPWRVEYNVRDFVLTIEDDPML